MRPRLLLACGLVAAFVSPVAAEDSLATRIDRIIEAKAKADGIAISKPADDAELVRRVYLDLAGRIPTVEEVRKFLADPDPKKREKLIDRLLKSAEYATRMADLFDVMFMERLGENAEWKKYLHESFAANKPWDQMAREILRADSKKPETLGAAFFIAKRLEHYGENPIDYSALTRDVGRLFLGKNFQCCECHDHLFIEDYKQQDFQGLHTFFKNTFLPKQGSLVVAERPTVEKTSFASVFTKVMMTTGPALPGAMMVEIPTFAKGEEFAEKPDRKTGNPGVPKFSTLEAISRELPKASNRNFTRNIVNRLWFAMMGRGIVHPLDLHHSHNPGSHPELLAMLADEFAARKFDIQWLVRELALTRTYQRSSLVPAGKEPASDWYFATALEKRLTADQLLANILLATGTDPKAADSLRPEFIKAFANQAREPEDEIAPSLKAALFLLNDKDVLALLEPKDGNLVDRLAKLPDERIAEELYVSILSRMPGAEEAAIVARELKKNPAKKGDAIERVAWALLASMEFGVNH
jgi:hypothetical protein